MAATSAGSVPAGLDDELCEWPAGPILYTGANVRDQWPQPITPLTQELVLRPQEKGAVVMWSQTLRLIPEPAPGRLLGCFYGWVYLGVDHMAEALDQIPGYSMQLSFQQFLALAPDPAAPPAASPSASPLRLANVGIRFGAATLAYPRQARRYRRLADERLSRARARDWSSAGDPEIEAVLRESAGEWPQWRVPLYLAAMLAGMGIQQLGAQLQRFAGDDGSLFEALAGGLGGIELADASLLIDEVARGRRSFDDLMAQFELRAPNEYELAASTWGENRDALRQLVEAGAGAAATSSAEAAARRRAARAEARRRTGRRWPQLATTLRFLDHHMRWRENAKVHEVMHVARQRIVAREAGRRLAARHVVDDPDDVFFLRAEEMYAALRGRPSPELVEAVARRRRVRDVALTLDLPRILEAGPEGLRPVPDERIRALGLLPEQPETADEAGGPVLNGEGVASGRVTGRARVVLDPFAGDLEPGEVLVAHTTDPAWTPLFAQASAVVLDGGGYLSHAAVLSRELGIPCVVNLGGATRRIATGAKVAVDGHLGRVEIL